MSTESIVKMAFDLGNAIASSDEIQNLKDVQAKLTEDKEAYDLIMRYQDAKTKLDNKANEGIIVPDNEESHVQILEQQLNSNSLVKELIAAQEKFDNLMQGVYFAMNQAISGGENCAPSDCGTCGSDCSQ
ncbi:hypothetical protein SYNTR_0845 [Candidatus Syntrophocurvum alkaliphilum]|uniref:Uncharacterized protein n=1 Tax=Candidatus Syntrophocurvum alkaliphilum TaxID=2293317 RepID=A0A6I6D941_9FIRM|nr:YlbF family regulator [Candidatus Syntrophocurvum alkaliphilum]QGT99438.1 hypothetical protein SYNTR_0845 [Candidatus Syntrophocurvum alkaliphilum]